MNREQTAIVALGVVALLAFGAGAATIDATVSGVGDAGPSGSVRPADGDSLAENVSEGVFAFFDEEFRRKENETGREGTASDADGERNQRSDESMVPSSKLPIGILAAAAVVVVAVAVVAVRRSGGDESDDERREEADADDEALAGVGGAAGAVADRLTTDADPENAVYEAWLDMTRHLDVERPESTTPTEFARAAVEAGMARDDVDALTTAFEEVRYGGEPVTDERRRRAVSAFRHVEETYADADEPADSSNRPDSDTEKEGSDP